MKLLVTGHAGHGKDTVCQILVDHFGLSFVSSSYFVMKRAVMPYLEMTKGLYYDNDEACYADRVNNRAAWYEAIRQFNRGDEARLGRELFMKHDIYCGLRSIEEFQAMKKEKLFDATIWVDASKRHPPEPETSMTIKPSDCDHILDNNGGLADLGVRLTRLYVTLLLTTQKA